MFYEEDILWAKKISSLFIIILTITLILLYKRKKEQIKNINYFLPLKNEILTYRKKMIKNEFPIDYNIFITILENGNYFIDLEIRFYLKNNKNIEFLFLDFYNYPKKIQMTINDKKFFPKIFHGRIYLKKNLLFEKKYNICKISFFSKLRYNFFSKLDNDFGFVLNCNENLACFLFPCFCQDNFLNNVSMKIKTFFFSEILFSGNLIKKKIFKEKECFYVLEEKNINFSNFFFLIRKKKLDFQNFKICKKKIEIFYEKEFLFGAFKDFFKNEILLFFKEFLVNLENFYLTELELKFENLFQTIKIYFINGKRNKKSFLFYSNNKIIIIPNRFEDKNDIKIYLVIIFISLFFEKKFFQFFQVDKYELIEDLEIKKIYLIKNFFCKYFLIKKKYILHKFYFKQNFEIIKNLDFLEKIDNNLQILKYKNFKKINLIFSILIKSIFEENNFFYGYGFYFYKKKNNFKIKIFNDNYFSTKNLIFYNINFEVNYLEFRNFKNLCSLKIFEFEEFLCFLNYVYFFIFLSLKDFEIFIQFLKKNKKFLKNSLSLFLLEKIIKKHFLKKYFFSKINFRYLFKIFVEINFFEDYEILDYFRNFFEEWKLFVNFQKSTEFLFYLKTNYDFYDYSYLENILE